MTADERLKRLGPALVLVLIGCASTGSPQSERGPAGAIEQVVEAPEVEKAVVQALDEIALGRGEYQKRLSVPFVIGPALWADMVRLHPALVTIGTESTAVVDVNGGRRVWRMRSFVDAEAVVKIARHAKLRAVAEAFRDGEVRPATSDERRMFHALSPLAIAGKPLTVFEVPPHHRLVIFAENGRLAWLDLLSEYR